MAGLHRSHVGGLLRSLEGLKPDESPRTQINTLDQLADAARVRRAWFSYGQGSADSEEAPELVARITRIEARLGAPSEDSGAPAKRSAKLVVDDDRMHDNLRSVLAHRHVEPSVLERVMKQAAGKGANYSEAEWIEIIDEHEKPPKKLPSAPPESDDWEARRAAAKKRAKKK